MAARRGLGITSKDMEASRLVFCFVKDSKPKRKVAIPVPDSYTWEQFLDQVKAKLKLSGVAEIYFSSNGQKVRSVSELQDIDELCVVEGPDVAANGGAASSLASSAMQRTTAELPLESAATEMVMSPSMRQQSIPQDRHKIVVSADGMMPARSGSYAADEEDFKYARRAHPLKRTLQRLFPSMFAPGLPVTARDAQDSSDGNSSSSRPAGRRRRRRSPYDARNLLLVLATMSCVFTMLYLFLRMSNSPGVGGMGPAQQAAHEVTEVGQAAAAVAIDAAAAAADAVKAGAAAAGGAAGAAAGGAAAPGAPLAGGGGGTQAAPAGGGGVP